MTAAEHSKLPWHDDGYGISDNNNERVVIYGFAGKELGNRTIIIRAIKSHAKLLVAAKEALRVLPNCEIVCAEMLEDAIAVAEELTP